MRLKILASAILALILGYVFVWHYMAGELEDKIEAWVGQQKSNGLNVSYEELDISGFPYRLELSLKSLEVVKTGEGKPSALFTSPKVTLVAFPWKINHGVIISDGGQLRIGSQQHPGMTMVFGKSRSSVLVELASRTLRRASFVLENVTWTTGPRNNLQNLKPSEAREVRLHIARPPHAAQASEAAIEIELPVQMKLYLEARDVTLQEMPLGMFGKKADQVKIDLQLHGENFPVYSKDGLAAWRDNGGTLAVQNFEVTSGEMDLELDGEVTLDQDLKPLGSFSSKIHGIEHILGILSRHSAFQMEPGSVILDELKRMSKTEQSGAHKGEKALDLAISLQGGLLFVGPIPVYELRPVVK